MTLFFGFHPHYVRDNTFFWACVVTLPLSMHSTATGRGNYVFWLAIGISLLSFLLPTVFGLYVLLLLILIVLLQSVVGKLNYTLLFHALLASPLFIYFKSLVSFPIRLHLSVVVTELLRFLGMKVSIDGNLVTLDGNAFLIDEACAGMYMLGYGLLFGTIVLSLLTKGKSLQLWHVLMGYLVLLVLIFLGNISRIALLIFFNIRPEHWLHEGLGLMIYVFQILIPFFLLIRLFTRRMDNIGTGHQLDLVFPSKKYFILTFLMVCVLAKQQVSATTKKALALQLDIPGYTSHIVKGDVLKLSNENSIVYIKSPVAPYRADHNPMVCWRGSGFSFKKIDKWPFQDLNINHAELVKGQQKVHTAWWFQSVDHRTGNQFEWRKRGLLNHESFYLINVTSPTKEGLKQQINILLDLQIIS